MVEGRKERKKEETRVNSRLGHKGTGVESRRRSL